MLARVLILTSLGALATACSSDPAPFPGTGSTGASTSTTGQNTGGAGGAGGAGGMGGAGGTSSVTTTGSGGAGPCAVFPEDNWWKTDISAAPVDTLSDQYIATIGLDTPLFPNFGTDRGTPYVTVDDSVPKSPVTFLYADESDPGPYPIPMNPPTDGDGIILMVHEDECVLYELLGAAFTPPWEALAGAIWDLKTNSTRPPGWTSADSAGLPIYPGLARHEEAVTLGEIGHALRFTVQQTQRAYAFPASHFASANTDPNLPPMGLRLRLKPTVDISGFPPEVQVILAALQKHGMFLAGNGGDLFVSGAPDPDWNDANLQTMGQILAGDFEAIETGPLTTN